jgi:hypothetical protein
VKKLLHILFIAAIVISGSANGREITGQVFIVTKENESVDLGLVSISVYPLDQVQSVIESVDADLKADRKKTAELASATQRAYKAASQASDQLWNDAIASSSRNRNVFKAVERVRSLAKDLLYLERTIRGRLNFLLGSAPYFRKLNELYRPAASAKSDADGKFSISVPDAGEFAIVAYAERQTFDKTEKYFWVVPVAERIDLSSDNQTSATSGASLLHVVGNDDLADATVTGDAIQSKFDEIKNKYADIFPAVAASAPH